ncbi:MAG: M23 family metallopeptidase [Rhodothermales bacterium]|nr:M23 family metallopeptidase [Rhodothermales bacterium]
MFSFLGDFIRSAGQAVDVILLDEDGLDAPRRYRVRPGQVLGLTTGISLVVGLLLLLFVVATPVRGLFPGLATEEMKNEARLNSLRLSALEDSLSAQEAYLTHIRDLMMGRVEPGQDAPALDNPDTGGLVAAEGDPVSADWEDHQQPAIALGSLPIESGLVLPAAAGPQAALGAPRFPVLPPIEGLATRGFDPRIGHYALDIAANEGTVVRSISAGYVVMADWTHDGGYTIAVQHAGGYLSVYKHNERLLKRAGDRVASREPISMSGNTGEITTGPHLHFELWRDGLAQDPSAYLLTL